MSRTILIDMDDTLCDLVPSWINILNTQHCIKIRLKDCTSWDIPGVIKRKYPRLTDNKIFAPFNKPGLFRDLPIMPGVKQALAEMNEREWRPIIVTSLPTVEHHPGQIVQEKSEWIEEHLEGLVDPRDIVFTYRKSLVKGDVLIDDAAHNLEPYPGKTIAFDRPWNKNVKTDGRVYHWIQMVGTCHELFQENI